MNICHQRLSSLSSGLSSAARRRASWRYRLALVLLTALAAAAGLRHLPAQPAQAEHAATLHGAAALEQLKQAGQYGSLQAAMRRARLSVNHVAHSPLGRAAWHAPNAAAGYDAYVTEAGVSLVVGQDGILSPQPGTGQDAILSHEQPVSLRLQRLGYGDDLQTVVPGTVSGDQQAITIERDNIREWFVNGADGLEHGFTLDARPPLSNLQSPIPLRLALQVSKGWRAESKADGQAVNLHGPNRQVINYGKLAVCDSAGQNIPAKLTVANEQVVIEIADRDAQYPLTIDPLFTLQKQLLAQDGAAFDYFGYAVALDGNTALVGAPNDDAAHTDQGAVYVFVRSGGNWTLQQKLSAGDAQPGDKFGSAVALSGDTALIGAPEDGEGTIPYMGSAYVFVRSGTTWALQQKLGANDGLTSALFGAAVALDGNTALVGAYQQVVAPRTDPSGAAYIFVRNGTQWTKQQRLTSNDFDESDLFGFSVALDGDTALIGAPNHVVNGSDQGAAYLFTRSGTNWTQLPPLVVNGAQGDHFGAAVALSGDKAAIGAPLRGSTDFGRVYTYLRSAVGWTLDAASLAPTSVTDAHFGESLAMDGGLLVVGASLGLPEAGVDQRTAYVYAYSGEWLFNRQLGAEVGNADDRFGYAVAVDGDTVLTGAYRADAATLDQGAAYVFTLRDSQHLAQPKLLANDGDKFDNFGRAVTVSGDIVAVGAPLDNIGTKTDQGSVYVFIRTGGSWAFQQQIIANDGAPNDTFGWAVALSGETLAVGAPNAKIGANTGQGAVYVFTRNGTTWNQQRKIFTTDGAATDACGSALALDGDTLAVGAPNNGGSGSVYIFLRTGVVWAEQVPKLRASDGEPIDHFGEAVALHGNTVVAGAPLADINGKNNQGAAYVFTRTNAGWAFQQKLTASDGAADDLFGVSVAVHGDTAAAGAYGNQVGTNSNQGAVYVFTRGGTSWTQQPKLSADAGAAADHFGGTVALSGDTLVAGAFNSNNQRGAAYVFTRLGAWRQQQRLTASDGQPGDFFGNAVALSGDTIVVGAYGDDNGANDNQGSAYTFVAPGCPALTLTPATLPNGPAGAAYSQALNVSGGRAGDEIYFSLSGGALPPGVVLDFNAAGAVLFGTPTTPGTYRFTITARSYLSQCPAVRSYTLTITPPCPPLSVTPETLPNGVQGVAYSQTLTAAGGTAPYSFSLAAGAFPAGLSLSNAGTLSGVPTVNGPFSFTLRVTAANGCQGTRAYTLTIAAPPCPTLTLTPATLPNATVGVPYSQTLTATGGTAPYTFSVTTGALPPGVSLNAGGALSGTPTAAGPYNFTAQASDANACTGTRAYTLTVNQTLTRAKKGDFDGDGKADLTYWRGATSDWVVRRSSDGQLQTTPWGAGYAPYYDVIVPGDYDGDGKQDHAIWRGQDTLWYIRKSSDGQPLVQLWGANYAPYFDVPTPGDFDGDGKTDMAVWRPTDATFYVKRSSNQTNLAVTWGQQGDLPVAADYDGDGKCDFAVWRPSTGEWLIQKSSGGTQTTQWGAGYAPYFDVPVVGDYDGDGKADPAIWRGQDSLWYIRKSSDGQPLVQLWGANYAPYFDVPVPADYDGDGKADIAVWRPTDGVWYVKRSLDGTNFVQAHGQNGDTPAPAHGVK